MATKKRPLAEVNGVLASDSGVLTLAEAAALLRVPEEGLRGDAEAGHVPARKVAGEWRFVQATLLEWLSSANAVSRPAKTGAELVEHIHRVHAASTFQETEDESEAFLAKIYAERKANTVGGSSRS